MINYFNSAMTTELELLNSQNLMLQVANMLHVKSAGSSVNGPDNLAELKVMNRNAAMLGWQLEEAEIIEQRNASMQRLADQMTDILLNSF
jgi:translation initiation factor 6 (eIF-6)